MNLTSFLPAFIWALCILALSISPSLPLPDGPIISVDKLAHAVVYGILTWLILKGWSKQKEVTTKALILAIGLSSLYGALLECVQYAFFPGRYFEVWDMIANIIGAIIGRLFFRDR